MGQKVNIPSQNQPFRRQASIGGNVSFRNIGDNNDNSFIALAKVTRVYYQRGKLDFKLTNTNSLVADRSGNGSGSAPIPVDFFGRRKNGQVFGHYRPVKIGDLIAVAYVNGHKSSPIVIGVYPNSGQDYEIISPSLYLDGDDEDAGVAETALAEQKIYPSMQLEYRSGSGTIAKALNGHSFLTVDDETSHQYDKLWQNYNTVGFFHNSSDAINPLKETAGDWLLVHEDNPLSDDGDNHRTRFFVNKKGEIQIVLMDNTSAGTISVLEGSKQDGFTISQYYDLQAKKSGDLGDDVYEPDFKSATNYVSLNVGKDQEIALEVAAKNSSKLELKSDGLYLNGKPFVESLNQRLDDLSDDIKKNVPSNSDFNKLANIVSENAQAAKDAAESAEKAGENAKQAGLAAEIAGDNAEKTGDDIKKRIIYYASISKEKDIKIPGKYIIVNTDTYIADGTIKNAYIEDGAIDHAKIADEAVGSSQIEDSAITRAKIADAAIGSAQIEDASITDAKIGSLSADKITTGTLDAGKINVINLNADSIVAGTITADKLNIKGLSDITSNAGIIKQGTIQAGDDPTKGVVINNLDADNPNKYTPAKKAFLLSEVQKLNSAAEAAIDYGQSTGVDCSAVQTAKQAMDNGLAPLLSDMTTTTEFDYNTVIKLEQDLQDAINAFHNSSSFKIGKTADGKNTIYRGADDPVTMGEQPHENDIWLQILNDGTYNIRVWDGAQWINPGLANIKAVSDSLSSLPKSYYQPEEPVGGDVHDGDTWYKLTKGSDGNYTYVAYKRENGQWVKLLDSNDVNNQTAITNLHNSLSKLPQSYYSSTQPAGTDYKDGDIWYKISTNTTNNNVVYTPFKWNPNTNTWDPMLDASSSRNYVGSAPASPLEGDFWMDNTTLKQYQNGVWKTIPTQGPQGVPGVSAKQQYIHIAYATSADGKNNFSVDSFSGATYIGLLVDFNEEDSKDPTKYTWSLMKGTDGKDGVPGKPGADGKTSYVHFAYANSSDGKTDFSVKYFDNALYIGTYTDFTEEDSSDYTKYTWSRLKGDPGEQGLRGLQGPKGDQGIQGPAGADGKSSYTHIAYANSSDGKTDFTVSDSNRTYIGMYVDFTSEDSTDPTKYAWSLIKGADGKDGTPGKAGADGKTPYLHIAYADSSDGKTNFSLDTPGSRKYIGSYTDFTQADSTNPALYSWQLVQGPKGDQGDQGIPGKPGADGKTYYTWIKYATDGKGSNMSDSPTGMSYIGIAYNKESSTESSTPTDYKWTKIKGDQGIPGDKGADGKTSYLHIAYSNSADGKTGFTTSPDTKISYNYMGTYTDYTQAGSTDPSSYTWVAMFDSTKKRNFTTQPTTPYAVGDTWTQSGATYFCTTARDSGAFDANDWTMQQLTIQSLDSNIQTDLNNSVKTTRNYKGVTLNDAGLTATAGSTTVAMNSNDGFLINNLKHDSADNPGGQVFHVDTDGNLTISGNLTAGNSPTATISGVNFTGQNLTLSGSLKLTGDESAIASKDGEVVFNKNGISATSGPITVNINGTNPLRIQSNNNDIFRVDNDGNVSIKGDLSAGDSPNSTISGVNFTGDNLTLSGSMKVNGQILFANSNGVFNGVLSSQGLSLKGGGLSISDDKGNQTTYVTSDGTFTTKKGFFSGTIKGSNIILNNDDGSVINANGGTFMVDGAGNVTAKSLTLTGNGLGNGKNSASLSGVNIYNGSIIEGSQITGNTITGNTITGGKIIGSDMIGGRFSSQSNGANGISAVEYNHEYINADPNVSPNFYVTNSGALQLTKVIKSDIHNTPGSFYTPYHIDGDINIAITKGEQDYKYYRLGVYAAQDTNYNDGLDIIYNLANNALNSNALSNNYLRGMNRYCFTLSEIPTGKNNIGITDSFSNPKTISLASDDFNSGLLNITYNGTTKSVNTNQEWYHLLGDLGDRQYVSIPMSFTAGKSYELGIIVNANQEESNISLLLESVGTKLSKGSYSSFSNVNIAPSGSLILSHGLYSNGYSEASGEANEAILNSELYRTELNSNSVHVSSITRGSNRADGASYYNYVDISSRGIYIAPTQHPDSQDSPARLAFAGDNSDNTGIFFDGYGNLHGEDNSAEWKIQDDKNNSVAIFPLNEQNNLIQFYTGLKVFPSGADHGIRTAWVSWSGWDGGERYPAIVQDGPNWGGIAFPKSGRVTLFDHDGHYYTPDRDTGHGPYNGYGG